MHDIFSVQLTYFCSIYIIIMQQRERKTFKIYYLEKEVKSCSNAGSRVDSVR